jgi:hypothetical protein
MIAERRVTIPTVDPMTLRAMGFRDEELRLAQFKYSATVLAGSRANFRLIEDEPTHQERQ